MTGLEVMTPLQICYLYPRLATNRSLIKAASIDTQARTIKSHAARPVYQKKASIIIATPPLYAPADHANLFPKVGSSRTRTSQKFSPPATFFCLGPAIVPAGSRQSLGP